MNLILENVSEQLAKTLKQVIKLSNENVKIKTKQNKLEKALKEAKDIEKNPHRYKGYTSADELIKDCLNG